MLDRGHHLVFCGAVARQLVRDHDTRDPALLFQQLAQQALGGPLVPPLLDENVEHDPILIDSPPEPVLLAGDHQAHFVEVPFVSRTGQPTPDLVGEALAELARPLAHGLVAHVNAAGGQHLFHHAQAQREPEVEPHGVADDLARKAVTGVRGLGCGCHASHLPVPALSAKPRPKLTVPPAHYRIITTNELDAYEAPLMAAEAEIFGLNRVKAPGDNFAGTARKAAKLSISKAAVETFSDISGVLASLPTKDPKKVSDDSKSGRIADEERNVQVRAFLYAASRESDNDFHLIVGDDPKKGAGVQMMTMEISGLPHKNSASFARLKSARDTYKDFFKSDLPGFS